MRLMRCVVAYLCSLASLCVLVAAPAGAQTNGGSQAAVTTERASGILTDARMALGATWLPKKDERFNWDIDFEADLDVLDVGFVRANFFFDFETIAGTDFRRVDPNQTNYTLDVSVFGRLPRGELGVTFHHVSRHRSDRDNRQGISWNMLGVVYGEHLTLNDVDIRASARALKTIEHSMQVDYAGEISGSLEVTAPINGRVALYADMISVVVPVDAGVFDRDTRAGGLIEGGFRVSYSGAALELYGGWERRIDADPIELKTEDFWLVGFRIVTLTP